MKSSQDVARAETQRAAFDLASFNPTQNPSAKFTDAYKAYFSEMMRDPSRHHAMICAVLRQIAHLVSGGIVISNESLREDAEGDVVEHLIKSIHKYQTSRNSAFEYFRQIANTKFWAIANDIEIDRQRSETPPAMEEIYSQPSRPDPMENARRMRHKRSYALIDTTDRNTFSDLVDELIKKGLKALRTGEHDRARMNAAIDTLQEVRFATLGEYRAILTPGVEYTKSRRLPREE